MCKVRKKNRKSNNKGGPHIPRAGKRIGYRAKPGSRRSKTDMVATSR